MSRSFRTRPPALIAASRRGKTAGGRMFPTIIERQPSIGDIHPLDKKLIRELLPSLPEEYLYGLRSIELRPRKNAFVGYPFGQYRIKDKTICLFSLPFPTWSMPKLRKESRRTYRRFGAIVEDDDHASSVHWPELESLRNFQTECVFLHELGHHYQYRFRTKKPLPADVFYEELLADAHARKLAQTER